MARPSASSVSLVQIAREKRKSLLQGSDDSGGDDGVHQQEQYVLQNRSLAKSNEIMNNKLGEMERRMGDLIEENMQLRHRNSEGAWRANLDARLLDLETQLSAKVDEMFLVLHAFRASRPGRPRGVLQPAMARVTGSHESFESSKSSKSSKGSSGSFESSKSTKSPKESTESSESSKSTKIPRESTEGPKESLESTKSQKESLESSESLKESTESSSRKGLKESTESTEGTESTESSKRPRSSKNRPPAHRVRKNVVPSKESVAPLSKANVTPSKESVAPLSKANVAPKENVDKENVPPPAKKNSTAQSASKRPLDLSPETPRRVRARKPVDYVGPSLRKKLRRESVRLVDAVTDEYFGREPSGPAARQGRRGREPLRAKDTNREQREETTQA